MKFCDFKKIAVLFGVLAVAFSDTPTKTNNNNNNNNNNNINNNNITPDAQNGFTPLSAPFPSAMDKSSLQLLENTGFDPSLYQTYMPQDTVQQYVNSFGGPYAPGTAYSATGFDPDNTGYSVQNGFEGFLVPQLPPQNGVAGSYSDMDDYIGLPSGLIPVLGAYNKPLATKSLAPALKTVLSPFGLDWLVSLIPLSFLAALPILFGVVLKVGSVLLGAAAVAGIGGLIMHLICSVTSVCSLTLNKLKIPFLKWTEDVKSNVQNKIAHTLEAVAETVDTVNHHIEEATHAVGDKVQSIKHDVAAKVADKVQEAAAHLDISPDRIKRATEFVMGAIKKYEELQNAGEIESVSEIIDQIAG